MPAVITANLQRLADALDHHGRTVLLRDLGMTAQEMLRYLRGAVPPEARIEQFADWWRVGRHTIEHAPLSEAMLAVAQSAAGQRIRGSKHRPTTLLDAPPAQC